MASENRILKRDELSILHQKAFCHFYVKGQKIELPVIDFHHKGACLSFDGRLPRELCPTFEGTLDFFVGKKKVYQAAPFQVAWINNSSKKIGIKFLDRKVGAYVRQDDRFSTSPDFAPTVFSVDPLDPNRSMFFTVRNFSTRGVSLSTSLTNRHILPGMTFNDANIYFPNAGQARFSIQVADVRIDDLNKLQIGCKITAADAKYPTYIRQYFNIFGPLNEESENVRRLFSSGLVTKKIKAGLNFKKIESDEAYDDLLKLRHRGYRNSKKINEDAHYRSLGEGLENEGFLGGAYLKGKLVGGFELRFGDKALPFRLLSNLGPDKIKSLQSDFDFKKIVEISKLVVDPDYHGTDLVLGIMQKMVNVVIATGQFDGLITATENLVPLYEKVGFRPLNYSVPHPVLRDVKLIFMLMEHSTFAEAKNMSPILWDNIYRQSHENFVDSGIVRKFKFNWRQKCLLYAGRMYLRLKEKTSSRPRLHSIVGGAGQKHFAKSLEKLDMLARQKPSISEVCKTCIDFAYCNSGYEKFLLLLKKPITSTALEKEYCVGFSDIQMNILSRINIGDKLNADLAPTVGQVYWSGQGISVENLELFRSKHGELCFQELEWAGLNNFMVIPIFHVATKTPFGVIIVNADVENQKRIRDLQLLNEIAKKIALFIDAVESDRKKALKIV